LTVPPPKIQLPRIPPSVIARTELVRTLDWNDAEETSRAVLVCAPAGYGKTTLLALHAQRLKSEGRLVGWMTCDRHDADATLLWQAVLAALSSAVRHSPERAALADPFRSLTVPPTMERAFLAELTEAVEALDAPVTLVLDDVHEVTGSATLAGLTDFLRNLPDRLNLIIGSRRDPAIPLHRLRLEGRLREVRGKDLAFGRDEVDQVLQGHGVHLDDPDLTILCRRTEGWPAAVRLAALALAEEPDPGRFVAEFAGDDTAVAGYLVAEILSRQQDTLQQFLLDTCVADTLTGELAASLSGRSDAGAILDGLEQANALVQRLGRSGVWFRYHSLLRSYLLAELRRRDLSATRARHRQAALWFDNAGFAGAALEHAVAANDEALIGDLLSRHGIRLLLTGSGSLLRRAIVDSPPRVRDDPGVLLLASIAAFDADDRVSGDQALARFDIGPEHGAQLQRLQDAARLYQARLHGDTAALLDIGDDRAASATGRSVDEDVELLVLVNRAVLSITAGDPAHAMADLRAALELALIRGHHRLALDSMNQLTGVAIGLSDIKESQEWARRAADFAADHGWATSPKLTYSHLIAGWCSYLTLDLDEATRLVEMSIAVLQGGAVEPEAETAARSGAAVLAFDRYPRRREALRDMEMIWQGLHEFVPSPALTGFAQLAEMQNVPRPRRPRSRCGGRRAGRQTAARIRRRGRRSRTGAARPPAPRPCPRGDCADPHR
jgi:LuxR family transcriptional regulator, maltose regulon positive regulatory protein